MTRAFDSTLRRLRLADPRARAGRNSSPAPAANASTGFSRCLFTLGRELAVSLQGTGEVAAHRLARGAGLAIADRIEDPAVLFLDQREVGLLPAHALGQA